jgi:hypothetical protein
MQFLLLSNLQTKKKKPVIQKQAKQKSAKPRQRRNKRTTSTTSVVQTVRAEMDKERDRLDLHSAGVNYLNMAMDPWDDAGQHLPKTKMFGFPDTTAANTMCFAISSRIEVSGATSTAGVISVRFDQGFVNLVENNYGTDPSDSANTPTAIQALAAPREAAICQAINDYFTFWRLVACCLKCNCLTTGDKMGGQFWGFLGDGRCRTAAATWVAYSNVLKYPTGQFGRSLAEGMSVRSRPCAINREWHTAASFPSNQYADLLGLAEVPHIAYDIEADAKFSVDAIAIFEVQIDPLKSPFHLNAIVREPEWEGLAEFLSDGKGAPLEAKGRSFLQFLRTVGKVAANVFRVGAKIAPFVGQAIKAFA